MDDVGGGTVVEGTGSNGTYGSNGTNEGVAAGADTGGYS